MGFYEFAKSSIFPSFLCNIMLSLADALISHPILSDRSCESLCLLQEPL